MATGYTTNIRMITPTQGTLNGTWGDTINNSITSLADAAIAGTTTVSMTTADYTLSVIDGAADEARSMFLYLTGAPGAARNVICPALSKLYFVANATAYDQTLKTPSGTGITVPTGKRMILFCNGTNVLEAVTYASMVNTFTGDQNLNNNSLVGAKMVGFYGEYNNGNSSTAVTITLANGLKQKVTLTGNATITINTTNALVGSYQLRIIQDGTGGRTIAWSGLSGSRWLGSVSAPAPNTAIGGESIVAMFFDGVNITQSMSKVGAG